MIRRFACIFLATLSLLPLVAAGKSDVQLRVKRTEEGNLYNSGSPVVFETVLRSTQAVEAVMQWVVTDFWKQEVLQDRRIVTLQGRKPEPIELDRKSVV